MTNEWELKELFVELGSRIWQRNYVAANDGNITVRLNDEELLITPTGISKGFMTTDMIIKVDFDGNMVSRNSKYKPSSELKMHLDIYKERPDVNAIIHAHPPFATSFAVAGIPLDKCVLPEAIFLIGAVPIAKYGLPSTDELPNNIRPHIKKNDVILLENHGALTVGADLLTAYFKMETLEHTANIVSKSIQLGNLGILPEIERDRLMALREKYHLKGKITTCCSTQLNSNTNKDVILEKINKIKLTNMEIRKITDNVLAKIKK